MDTTVTEKNYPIRLEWVLKFFGLVVLIGLSLIFLSRIGVIWDVTIHRDVFDRLVGLATLTIKSVPRDQDDNIEAARPSLLLWPFMSRMGRVYAFVPQSRAPQLGFYGNTLRIAGLSVSDAETLKEMLLQKKTVSSGIGG